MTAFIDTYAFIAWLNGTDADHPRVTNYFAAYRGYYVTTEAVLVEVADAFAKSESRSAAAALIRRVRGNPQFVVVPNSTALFDRGLDLYAARPDKGWSLTDCISFTVMTERGLTDALTADRHFARAGFRPVFNTPN